MSGTTVHKNMALLGLHGINICYMEPRYHNSPSYNDVFGHKRGRYNKCGMSGGRFATFNGSGSSTEAPRNRGASWDCLQRLRGAGIGSICRPASAITRSS